MDNMRKIEVPFPSCSHLYDEVPIGKYKILVTAYNDFDLPRPKINQSYFLSSEWINFLQPIEVFGKPIDTVSSYPRLISNPAIMVHWPDYGVLTYKQIDWLVNKIIVDLECGLVVETGCTGGHGRTGTLLACLAGKLLGLSATEAIQHIRKVYCMFAVEKESQIELIAEYLQSPIPSPADVHTHEFRYYR
jgi:hypothetical protein